MPAAAEMEGAKKGRGSKTRTDRPVTQKEKKKTRPSSSTHGNQLLPGVGQLVSNTLVDRQTRAATQLAPGLSESIPSLLSHSHPDHYSRIHHLLLSCPQRRGPIIPRVMKAPPWPVVWVFSSLAA